jgi:hypothetical protein
VLRPHQEALLCLLSIGLLLFFNRKTESSLSLPFPFLFFFFFSFIPFPSLSSDGIITGNFVGKSALVVKETAGVRSSPVLSVFRFFGLRIAKQKAHTDQTAKSPLMRL